MVTRTLGSQVAHGVLGMSTQVGGACQDVALPHRGSLTHNDPSYTSQPSLTHMAAVALAALQLPVGQP